MWTALQFDSAVMVWGRHVENKLNERNDDGRPKYNLYMLLDIEDKRSMQEVNQAGINFLKTLATMPGAVRIIRTE